MVVFNAIRAGRTPTVMMTQEEFMDVKGMRAAGLTYAEIAEATGYHRTTIATWIKAGGPPERRTPAADRVVLTVGGPRLLVRSLSPQGAISRGRYERTPMCPDVASAIG